MCLARPSESERLSVLVSCTDTPRLRFTLTSFRKRFLCSLDDVVAQVTLRSMSSTNKQCIYIYIVREREKEIERESERERARKRDRERKGCHADASLMVPE